MSLLEKKTAALLQSAVWLHAKIPLLCVASYGLNSIAVETDLTYRRQSRVDQPDWSFRSSSFRHVC